jgi:hypothetical protein
MGSKLFEIRVRGAIPREFLSDLTGEHPALAAQTLLTGRLRDQAEVHGLLMHLHHVGLEIVELRQLPDSEAESSMVEPEV